MVITKLIMITIQIPANVTVIAIANTNCESTVFTIIDTILVVVIALLAAVNTSKGSPDYCTLSFSTVNARKRSILSPF